MDQWTQLVIVSKNIYNLWVFLHILLPVTYVWTEEYEKQKDVVIIQDLSFFTINIINGVYVIK